MVFVPDTSLLGFMILTANHFSSLGPILIDKWVSGAYLEVDGGLFL